MSFKKIVCSRSSDNADGFRVLGRHHIKPGADGSIFWHIVNFTPDMEKEKIIQDFTLAFYRWQFRFDQLEPVGRSIAFKSTSNYDEAHIRLTFLKPLVLDQEITRADGTVMKFQHAWPFDDMGGIVAHVPYTETNIYFDEGENWSDMFRWDGDVLYVPLLETVLHELGHCFDLDHSKVKTDIMFATTDEVSREITDDSFQGLIAAGWSDRKKQFPQVPTTPAMPGQTFKVLHVQDTLPKASTPYGKRELASISQIVVHHSADNGTLATIAKYHTDPPPNGHGWPGIGYTFVIYKDGTIYQVNDLDTKCFNVAEQNTKSLGICLIGDYEVDTPPQVQVDALKWLIATVRAVVGEHPVFGHRDKVNTLCPGKNLYSLINSLQ